MSCDCRHCPPHLPILPSSPAQRSHDDLLASIAPPLQEVSIKRTVRSNTDVVGYVQAIASSILVISWKCLVLGKPRARIPNACLDSWKCRSKFFLSQIRVNHLHHTCIIKERLPPHIHMVRTDLTPIFYT